MQKAWLLVALLTGGWPAAQAQLRIEDAWLRAMPPLQQTTAAYGVLHNDGERDVQLQSITSPQASGIEVHLSERRDGVYRMRRVDPVVIPAQGQLVLAPGAYHLMLFGVSTTLVVGDSVPLRVQTVDGQVVDVVATVRALTD